MAALYVQTKAHSKGRTFILNTYMIHYNNYYYFQELNEHTCPHQHWEPPSVTSPTAPVITKKMGLVVDFLPFCTRSQL